MRYAVGRVACRKDPTGLAAGKVTRPKLVTIAATEDAELLAAVAKDASEEALSELIRRFERPAFGLALHLTGNPGAAGDAVQAAFVRLWRKASSFERSGSVRNWIFKIVARESLMLLRTARKHQVERLPDNEPAARTAPEPEHGELHAALHEHLMGLPETDRQAVALYYAAGLSQDEIARELNVPQRTVSYRLKKALESLRVSLTAAGHAAAVPLLCADGLQTAICQGASSGVAKGVVVSKVLAQAARHSMRAVVRAPVPLVWPWVAALALAAVAAGAYLFHARSAAAPAPTPVKLAPQNESPPVPAEQKAEAFQGFPLPQRWSFERGIPENFIDKIGNIWSETHAGLDFLGDERRTIYLPNVAMPPAAHVTVTVTSPREGPKSQSVYLGLSIKQGEEQAKVRHWLMEIKAEGSRAFRNDPWKFYWVDGHLIIDNRMYSTVIEFEMTDGPVQWIIGIQGLILHSVEMNPLGQEDAQRQRSKLREVKRARKEPPPWNR